MVAHIVVPVCLPRKTRQLLGSLFKKYLTKANIVKNNFRNLQYRLSFALQYWISRMEYLWIF